MKAVIRKLMILVELLGAGLCFTGLLLIVRAISGNMSLIVDGGPNHARLANAGPGVLVLLFAVVLMANSLRLMLLPSGVSESDTAARPHSTGARWVGFALMALALGLFGLLIEMPHHVTFLGPSADRWLTAVLSAGPVLVGLVGWLQLLTGMHLRKIEAALEASRRRCVLVFALAIAMSVFLLLGIALGLGVGILQYESAVSGDWSQIAQQQNRWRPIDFCVHVKVEEIKHELGWRDPHNPLGIVGQGLGYGKYWTGRGVSAVLMAIDNVVTGDWRITDVRGYSDGVLHKNYNSTIKSVRAVQDVQLAPGSTAREVQSAVSRNIGFLGLESLQAFHKEHAAIVAQNDYIDWLSIALCAVSLGALGAEAIRCLPRAEAIKRDGSNY